MKKKYIYLALTLFILSFSACKTDDNQVDNRDISIIRFDKLLFKLDTANIEASFNILHDKYPAFSDIYFEKVVPLAGYKSDSIMFFNELRSFVSDTELIRIESMVEEYFSDMKDIENGFNKAIQNLLKLFPEEKPPVLYSYFSAFSIQRFIFEDGDRDGLAFSPELFLGDKFPYSDLEHGKNTFSKYLVRTYNKDHLVKKVMELWVEDKLGDPTGNRAIDAMIKNGKKLYILKRLMPEISDTVLLEYTPDQMDWLSDNEQEMWNFYIENNLFYTTDNYKIKRLTEPGPNSQALGMPKKSPGETGNYLGYKIVAEFMRRNGEMDVNDLINYKDSQKLMEKSRFKPKLK
ncbi:MAG TPA: hypothetical protein ENK91_01365 [Bacteroidetes bacterium]|nr:hypothetical protein [Bacteroidota bacterium]